jgi:uncharacterized C2H2 Zn-finger protein
VNCGAIFAEKKELYRHVRVAHILEDASGIDYMCEKKGWSFKKKGWLGRHLRCIHGET